MEACTAHTQAYRSKRDAMSPSSSAQLVGRRFAHQRFADWRGIDSRESIRNKTPIFQALGQIRANRVFSPLRIQIRVIRVQSLLSSIFCKVDSQNNGFFEARIDSQRILESRANRESICANRPTQFPLPWTGARDV